jgi:mannose-6-phosphate isomerase-like protein (cupin superfamily)
MPSHDFETQIHLRSAQSDGAVSVVELAASADFAGPPLHHHDFDEAFYVLEGEMTFQLGDELRTAGPGELIFAPRGSHHTLANLSGAPARYLVVCTPAGFENRFARTAAERAGVDPPAWALEPYPPTTFVGPRIGERDA